MSPDLSGIGAGFADPSYGSQTVFRSCLEAIARPGTVFEVESQADVPPGVHPAAYALLLVLLDQDSRLWIAPDSEDTAHRAAAGVFLRFHTGCRRAESPGLADFALLTAGRGLPPLDAFSTGTEEYPDRSATLVLQADALNDESGWKLTGPGIRGSARLAVAGLGGTFVTQWAENHRMFPRGVDVFVACGRRLVGLPRTTRIEA